jgi:SAM-dependent methyltransferase
MMSPERAVADPSKFGTVDRVSDPAGLIALLDGAKPLFRGAKSVLLERLALEHASTALDVGCGTGGDVVEMSRRMPQGAKATGVDASEAMIAEARRRAAWLSAGVQFRLGDALDLPYPDGVFDVCRVETVLQHLADPLRAIREMARVTRPGGRVGALEMDLGTMLLDHPDRAVTQAVFSALADSMAQPWMGRQLPRLFREAGLTGLSVDPIVILSGPENFRAQIGPAVTRLRAENVLTGEQARDWWSGLSEREDAYGFVGGATVFVVAGTRPLS